MGWREKKVETDGREEKTMGGKGKEGNMERKKERERRERGEKQERGIRRRARKKDRTSNSSTAEE